jgi:hypothetical protein
MSMGKIRRKVGDWEIKKVKSHADEVVVEEKVSGVVSVKLKNLTLKREGVSRAASSTASAAEEFLKDGNKACNKVKKGTSSAAASRCACDQDHWKKISKNAVKMV